MQIFLQHQIDLSICRKRRALDIEGLSVSIIDGIRVFAGVIPFIRHLAAAAQIRRTDVHSLGRSSRMPFPSFRRSNVRSVTPSP